MSMTDPLSLPVWPPLDNAFFGNAARCWNRWRTLGASENAAYGTIANHEAECAFHIGAIGDQGRAFGLGQWWWTPRGAAILAATGIDVRTEKSIIRQVDAAYWEITHVYSVAWTKIQAAGTVEIAGELVCTLWEQAGSPNAMQRRGLMANRWQTFFAANPQLLAANPA